MNKSIEEIFPNPPSGLDPNKLDVNAIPKHVAVIMDGNGRWAKQRGWKRINGHRHATGAIREIVRASSDLGVEHLTAYSFSSENWSRPREEVDALMDLFVKTLKAEIEELHSENVRISTIGNMSQVPKKTQKAFSDAIELTKNNTGLHVAVAINYGGRQEIVDAVNSYVRKWCTSDQRSSSTSDQRSRSTADQNLHSTADQTGSFVPLLTGEEFEKYLYTAGMPDPDLLIRTGGEMRISNFLLWQISYSEIVVQDVLWPDFNRYDFLSALLEFQNRNRRYGGVVNK